MAVLLLAAANLTLLVWAVMAYRRREPLPRAYFRMLPISPVIAAVLLAVGLWFFTGGMRPPGMHIFYGSVVGLGAVGQMVLGSRTQLGHRYRARPVVHGFLALFVGLLAVRAWMAA